MRPGRAILWLLAASLAPAGAVRAQDKDDLVEKAVALQKVTQRVIAQAEPSIACIVVSRGEARVSLDDPKYVPEAFGSGVVIDGRGLVLTNYHVVRAATKIYVRLPGMKTSAAEIHAADPRSDLAVLRLEDVRGAPFKAIRLGEAEKLERGQFLLSLANPFAAGFRDGLPSASWGMLSNIRRRAPTLVKDEERVKPLQYYGVLLQTDARLHLGSSGGALLNLQGELVGLTTALAAILGGETPGGFAVPIDAGYRRIIDVLKRGEEVEYGFLGVGPEMKPDGQPGVRIEYLTEGGPAKVDAKLQKGDRILAVEGIPVEESDDLFLHLGTHLAGNTVQLDIRRPGVREVMKVRVTLAKFLVPGTRIATSLGKRPFFRGLRVDYASLLVQEVARARAIPPGVLISEVQPDSAAATAALKPGEVITHVNDRSVRSPAQFYQAVAGVQGTVVLTLYSFSPQEPPPRVNLK